MSRLTGKEVYSLMEAYQAVYTPQELTEEQVWEGVENWVHSLLKEGYDLSDYTWEEMYESYLIELDGSGGADGVMTKPKTSQYTLKNLGAKQFAAFKGGGGDEAIRLGSSAGEVVAAGRKQINRFDGGSRKPIIASLPRNAAVKGDGPKGNEVGSNLSPFKPPTPTQSPARPDNSSGKVLTSTAPKPAVKTITPEKPMGGDPMDQWTRANPTLAAKVKQGQSGYNTIRTRLDADNDRQENYDAYDLVLSHLINEGYADTQEAALAIMGNMSEDWRQSIVEEVFDEARRADKLGYERGTAANPNIRNISHSDPSQRTMLNSKVRRRAEEMGRERRNSPKYKQGARPPLSAKEKSFLKFADRSSPTSGNPRNPNVQDTGSQTTWPSERRAQKDPKQNPKHNANRDNDK